MAQDLKQSYDSVNTGDFSLIPPLDYTDPIVRHDGGAPHHTIPVLYEPERSLNMDKRGMEVANQEYDQTEYLGIFVPIIKLNNVVLYEANIERCVIKYEGFLSKITLIVRDSKKIIQFADSPGMNGSIDVTITPSIPNVYRNIAMQFEITSFNVAGDTLYYDGRQKVINMEQRLDWGMIKYPGCSPPLCNVPPNPKPNTWEYLHEIALRCGLGFQTTDQCREIEDRLPRLLRSQSYSDFIEEQIEFGGLDENSIFDVWIDAYGYITMVNLPWVLDNDITFRHLSLGVITGIRSQIDELQKPTVSTMHRTLTNFNINVSPSNVLLEHQYEWITQNFKQQYRGNLERRTTFTPRGVRGGNNNLQDIEVQQHEGSADGDHTEDYEKHTVSFYCDFNDYDTKLQQCIRHNYLERLRAKRLKVVMQRANLGLQRGTLVNISIWEAETSRKSQLIQGSSHIGETDKTEPDNPDTGLNNRTYIGQEGNQVPNGAVSGLYYIDGMEFEWDNWNRDIKQTLYLIKKGRMSNPANKYSTPVVNPDWIPTKSPAGAFPDV